MQIKTVEDFTKSLNAAALGLYNTLNLIIFSDDMLFTIERNLSAAWFAGMRSCGLEPSDITPEEDSARVRFITSQLGYVSGLAQAIVSAKLNGQNFSVIAPRLDLWANRWNEANNMAKAMACSDQKQVWVLGATDHCATCLKMAGKVKRASQWSANGVLPQGSNLACGGWRCQCSLQDTNLPMSKGRLPSA